MSSMREHNRYLRGMSAWVGFDQTGVSYVRDGRYAGHTKYSLRKMIGFGLDGIVSFSTAPLRLALNVGFLVSALAFVVGLAAIVVKLAGFYAVPGWASIVVVIALLGGVQLTVLGVMGEYVAQIHQEVKQRPLYLVRDVVGLNEAVHVPGRLTRAASRRGRGSSRDVTAVPHMARRRSSTRTRTPTARRSSTRSASPGTTTTSSRDARSTICSTSCGGGSGRRTSCVRSTSAAGSAPPTPTSPGGSPRSRASTRRRMQSGARLRRTRPCRYEAYDGERLPYDDERFDVAFAICVLHHVRPAERPRFVGELRRVVRPGGLVALFEHNPLNPLTRLAVHRCAFDGDAVLLRAGEAQHVARASGLAAGRAALRRLAPVRSEASARARASPRAAPAGGPVLRGCAPLSGRVAAPLGAPARTIAVLGPGGIGGLIAARTGALCVGTTRTVEAIRADGLTLAQGGTTTVERLEAFEELERPVGLLVVAVKAYDLEAALDTRAAGGGRRRGRASAAQRPRARRGDPDVARRRSTARVAAGSIGAVEAYSPEPGLVVQLTPGAVITAACARARPRRARDRARAAPRPRARGRRRRRRTRRAVGEGREARGARPRDDRGAGRGGRRPCRRGWRPRMREALDEACAVAPPTASRSRRPGNGRSSRRCPPTSSRPRRVTPLPAGPTELDAITGSVVRAGLRLGVPTPALGGLLTEAQSSVPA